MARIEYAVLVYDIDTLHPKFRHFYEAFHRRVGRIGLPYTRSCLLVDVAQVNAIHDDIEELIARYGVAIEYNVRELNPAKDSVHREDSIKALNRQIKTLKDKLLRDADGLKRQFQKHRIGELRFTKEAKRLYSKADKKLRMARGLALLFLIEQDVKNALDSVQKLVEARQLVREIKNGAAPGGAAPGGAAPGAT